MLSFTFSRFLLFAAAAAAVVIVVVVGGGTVPAEFLSLFRVITFSF